MESKVKNENYITIQGFMTNELNLKGNELIIYACIYGFSQAENQVFNGSLQYLADWTNSTKQGIVKNLKSLEEKGYIIKKENYFNNVKFVEYYATKFNGGIKHSCMGGMQQSLPNNIDIHKIDNNIDKEKIYKKERFQIPSLEEVEEYCEERRNNVDAQYFIDYYTSKGWLVGKSPMKDWKASIRLWERKDKPKNKLSKEDEEYYDSLG